MEGNQDVVWQHSSGGKRSEIMGLSMTEVRRGFTSEQHGHSRAVVGSGWQWTESVMGSAKPTSILTVDSDRKRSQQLSSARTRGRAAAREAGKCGGWWEEEEDEERTLEGGPHPVIEDGATMGPQAVIGQEPLDVPNRDA